MVKKDQQILHDFVRCEHQCEIRCGMLFFHYVTEGQSHRCMQAEAFWSLRCDACSRHIPCSAVNSTIIKCMRWSTLLRRTQSIFSFNGLPGYPPEDHEPWPEHTASNHLRHEWKHKVRRLQGRCQEPFEPRRKQAVAWNGNKRIERTGQAGPKDRKRQVRSGRIRKNKADNHAMPLGDDHLLYITTEIAADHARVINGIRQMAAVTRMS